MIASGLSRASITVHGNAVTKRGARCREQGEWLYLHEAPILPRVSHLFEDGYTMERLTTPSTPIDLWTVTGRLSRLWHQPAEVEWAPEATALKVDRLLNWYALVLGDRGFAVRERGLETVLRGAGMPGLTHGDPTHENMLRRGADVVLADPIPATPAIPDVVEVDLGKLLQSALGWERVVRGAEAPSPWVLEEVLGLGDRDLIIAWCLVHLLRTLPYVDDHRAVVTLIDAALNL